MTHDKFANISLLIVLIVDVYPQRDEPHLDCDEVVGGMCLIVRTAC